MRHSLVLSGGGFKGIYQLEVAKQLIAKIGEFDFISGTSVGCLNGALLAMKEYELLDKLWEDVITSQGRSIMGEGLIKLENGKISPNIDHIVQIALGNPTKIQFLLQLISKKKRNKLITSAINNILGVTGLMTNDPLKKLLLDTIKISKFKTPFYFTAVSLQSQKLIEASIFDFDNDKDAALGILASSNMPFIFPPVARFSTTKETLIDAVDGGIRNTTPLSCVFDKVQDSLEDNTIWIINNNSEELEADNRPKTIGVVLGLTMNILLNEVFINDIGMAIKINSYASKIGKREVKIVTIYPSANEIGDTMDASKETLLRRKALGKLHGEQAYTKWQASL